MDSSSAFYCVACYILTFTCRHLWEGTCALSGQYHMSSLGSILFFKDLFYYSCVCMSIVALGDQKKVLDLQELELQDIVNCS